MAVLISDTATHQVVAVNDAAATLFATDRETLLATTVAALTHAENRPEPSVNYARSNDVDGFETLKRYVRFGGTDFMGRRGVPSRRSAGSLRWRRVRRVRQRPE